MADENRGSSPGEYEPQSPFRNRAFWVVLMFMAFGVVIFSLSQQTPGAKMVTYSEVKEQIREGGIERVVIHQDARIEAVLEEEREEDGTKVKRLVANRLPGEDETLIPMLDRLGVKYNVQLSCYNGGYIWMILLSVILISMMISSMRRMSAAGGGNNPAMDFAKSRAKMYVEEGTGVTFSDVAGCDEAKAELAEVVDFLQDPESISRLGGQVPKGVLLVGPPGTGKTLLARAVAGEAGVAFFNLSGSDFVEMFVGVGAARVRDLFKQATEHAPAIIFVDELDAIGKSRAANQIQSNDEREQTLNALLVEMDGFDARSGVIIIAATNRPEILDNALLRPGRFDRQVLVDRPDVVGREAILKTHTRKIIMADTVDLRVIAAQTPGFVGADLANVVNEAALLAARLGKDAVETADFQEAIERVMAGLEKKSRRLSEKEKDIVAYHEAGHAIVAAAVDHADPVHKVSIVSRGLAALGYTLQVPVEDRYLMTRLELRDRIAILLGGRAAEDIIFGDISTGASNDLERVTNIARSMIAEYGMSEAIGQVNYAERGGNQFLGGSLTQRPYSEETAVTIDREIKELVDTLYARTVAILERNIDLLHQMADTLKEDEVLEGERLKEMLDLAQAPDASVVGPSRDGSLP
jgi:cell division protease FtsH